MLLEALGSNLHFLHVAADKKLYRLNLGSPCAEPLRNLSVKVLEGNRRHQAVAA